MSVSKAQLRATAKYNKKNYDRIDMRVPKGKKEKLAAHAMEHDGSLNKFLNRAVDETIERDNNNWQLIMDNW